MSDETYQHLIKSIVKVERDVSSSVLRPLPIGGRMAYYTVAHDSIELVQAVKAATDIALPYLVIGQAGSTLIHDDGFPGLVIQNQAKHIAFSVEQSQIVVESGADLQQVIVQAASRGLGGLIHLYAENGSIGGALFYNIKRQGQSLFDSLRSLTVLMPPTRIKPEPTIVRFKGSWLLSRAEAGRTRLQTLLRHNAGENQPVILTAQLQLTSLRSDELLRRIQQEARQYADTQIPGHCFGPLLMPSPQCETEHSLEEILSAAQVEKIRYPGLFLPRGQRNCLGAKNRFLREHGGAVPTSAVAEYVHQLQQQVKTVTGLELEPAFLVH